ncbi:MAG: glutaredoxin family protein [Tepidiformaceae bacterium]
MAGRRIVHLYRRDGCPLCDEAEEMLRALAPGLGFEVEAIDIEADTALHRRYLLEIPVVVVDGREVARPPIRAVALREALREALRG